MTRPQYRDGPVCFGSTLAYNMLFKFQSSLSVSRKHVEVDHFETQVVNAACGFYTSLTLWHFD